MRKLLTFLATIVMCSQGFGVLFEPAAMTNSNSLSLPALGQGPVTEEVLDSQTFFETALKAGNDAPDPRFRLCWPG
jgi:hypothetical protein